MWTVSSWADLTGNTEHILTRTGSSGVTFREAGVDGFAAVHFDQGMLTTAAGIPTPANGTLTIAVYFRVLKHQAWQQLIGQGQDDHWQL